MKQVYSAAKQVLIWLGEARKNSDIAMEQLEALGMGEEIADSEKASSRRLIYDALIDRDWWGRLWIVQEVLLAKSDPIIMCGSRWLLWKNFMKGCIDTGLSNTVWRDQIDPKRMSQWSRLYDLRQRIQSRIELQNSAEETESLNKLLICTKDFDATDPRDKIYGCLGLLTEAEREAMNPKYQKSTQLVYIDVARYLLEHDNNEFFSVFSISKTGKPIYPSWVPDFSAQKTLSPSNPNIMTFRADAAPHGQRCVSFQDDNKTLAITGIFFDTITSAVELKCSQQLLISQIPELERLAQHAIDRKLLPNHSRYCFQKFKKHEDILDVLTGRPRHVEPSLRNQYDVLTGKTEPPSMEVVASEYAKFLHYLLHDILPGRYFFITKMGFVGIAVARVREHDIVTFLFGETLTTVLRPRGVSYNMVGAACVSGIMNGELTEELYESGLVEKTTFIIR
jgi:hypothetical protein